MAGKLQIDLEIETANAEKKAKSNLGRAGRESGTSFSIGFGTALKTAGLLTAIRLVSSGIGAIRDNITASISAAGKLEAFETQFKTILGSAKAAQDQIASLQKFAATTPFELPGLARATRQLLSFGLTQEEIIPTLRQLGDLAAGAGAEINELTTPFGRLISTQKLTLIELDKFNDRGINLYQQFADQTGRSIKDIRIDIEKGRVDFDEFAKAIKNLTSEGGTFFGATVAQSKTLSGLFSTLRDNLFNLRASVGKAILPLVKGISVDLINALGKATQFFIDNSKVITNSIFDIARSATFLIKPFALAFNFIKLGFLTLQTAIAGVVAGIAITVRGSLAPLLESLSSLPGEAGEKARGALQSINLFAEASQATLSETAQATKDALLNLFETGEVDAQLRTAIERYRELGITGAEAFAKILKEVKEGGGEIAKEAVDLGKTLRSALGNRVAQGVESLTKSIAAGENVFKAFSANIIGIVADFAVQAGKIFIATGFAQLSLFSGNPTALIAAGAGLVALGTLAKAVFGGGLDQGGGGASTIGPNSAPLPTQPEFNNATPEEREEAQTRVQLVVNGDIFDSTETGLRLSRILEESSLNENVKVFGGIA